MLTQTDLVAFPSLPPVALIHVVVQTKYCISDVAVYTQTDPKIVTSCLVPEVRLIEDLLRRVGKTFLGLLRFGPSSPRRLPS